MSDRLRELSRQMRLGNMAALIDQVEYSDRKQYVTELLELAMKQREASRVKGLIKQAGFPSPRTLDNFEFTPVSFPSPKVKEQILSLDFIDQRENVLMLGAVGTGKTHLATALGVKACLNGKKVAFYRTVNLTNELVERHECGQLTRFLKNLAQKDLLILDEMGYVPTSKKSSELLFSVISNAYEHQSIVITSNLELGRWNEMFGDDRLTHALIDRLVHHSYILAFSGESYRFKEALGRRSSKIQ